MAIVAEHHFQLIAKQVGERGIVVWYDTEQACSAVVAGFHLRKKTVAWRDGSYLKLRKEIDHLRNDDRPPRLVGNVPLKRPEVPVAPNEIDCFRVVVLPTQQALAGNTRLSDGANQQDDFLYGLQVLEGKSHPAPNLHLEPDLNDGVVLNIAPLQELVPWKEAKNYWEELLDGKYGWSSIGKQLREKGIVK